jgi:uncharacterized protein YdiU (UPF0061 family)
MASAVVKQPASIDSSEEAGVTLSELPKSWTFTSSLPPDPSFPTPEDSHKTPRDEIQPRYVRGALFTWVRPEKQEEPKLLAVSPAAMRDLGLRASEATTEEFRQTVVGNILHGWDVPEGESSGDTTKLKGYPWAQCYGGFQFGSWAGQLGDGRAISLFEATNPATGHRYEVALKGSGLTPYSRFADGQAVLRSSIREFVVSEALNALGIPTTRALALSHLPHRRVRRETIEPGAIVVRFAESWLRLGTFDLLRSRGDRDLTRRLATYIAENVFGGWDKLPGRIADPDSEEAQATVKRGVGREEIEGPVDSEQNRFTRLYREIVRRNAGTVARWQMYGFINGVLNTDNTSIYGLSIDFGPFAFLDNFDPSYTPNHDDHMGRYSYQNQPAVIWWNLARLGEALGELIGAGAMVDDETFVKEGVTQEQADAITARFQEILKQTKQEYFAVFNSVYKSVFASRLGLRKFVASDYQDLMVTCLTVIGPLDLDFNMFFRRLSTVTMAETATESGRLETAARFFYTDGFTGLGDETEGRRELADWLAKWRERIIQDWGEGEEADAARAKAMKHVNPNFIPRGWILDEVIRRVQDQGDSDVLSRIMHMALHPFEDSWAERSFDGVYYQGDKDEELRWTAEVPRKDRALQCSCSS